METNFNPARAVLCGSYHRDTPGLIRAYHELVETGCQVLSPHLVAFDDDKFVRDPAQQQMHPKTIQDFHLMSIRQADFVWLHAPEGYVGLSGALELGYALAHDKPVYCREPLADPTLGYYATVTQSVFDAKHQSY